MSSAINQSALQALDSLVTYNWSDEEDDFVENCENGSGLQTEHIFVSLMILNREFGLGWEVSPEAQKHLDRIQAGEQNENVVRFSNVN